MTEPRPFDFTGTLRQRMCALWLIAACTLAALLLGCNPYVVQPTATAETLTVTLTLPQATTPTPETCTVTGYLNFRERPTRSAAVIFVLKSGERVTVIERGDWLKVAARNQTGWVYGRYCQ